jgi:hypothetical protein
MNFSFRQWVFIVVTVVLALELVAFVEAFR